MSAAPWKVLAIAAILLGCRTEAPATTGPAPSASVTPIDAGLHFVFADAEPSLAPPGGLDAGDGAPDEAKLAKYARVVPVEAKSIGHTSVVFRVDFAGGLRAAYKPESKRGHKRYRGEVASYRLAKLLGLRNVPPAAIRTMPRAELRAAAAATDAKALSLFDDEVVDRSGRVYGALMPWIDKLEFYPLERPSEKVRWKAWLVHGGDIPAEERDIAAQVSTLLVFDALTANWDRWSGANVAIDRATRTLLFVDNDGAFADPPPPAPLAAQMGLVRGCDRFSRSLVARLRAIDPISLADAIGEEEPGVPLLGAHVLASVDQRRKDVLGVVDGKIAALGEGAVLSFP
ncbi:MAG TPA: hypothetical protein VLM85_18565 [Polyangiaceae bacterium]|nr:hypothetical protein [Polyangiaceae bacterium]